MQGIQDIDLENFDLDSAPPEPEPAPVEAKSDTPAGDVAEAVRAALDAQRGQQAEFLGTIARSVAPQPQYQQPELPKWEISVPDEIAAKFGEGSRPALEEYGRHLAAQMAPTFLGAAQAARDQAAASAVQQTTAYIEGQRMISENAPTYQRLPQSVQMAIVQDVARSPDFQQIHPVERWKRAEAAAAAIGQALGAGQPQQRGYAGGSVRTDLAQAGGRQVQTQPVGTPDDQASQIASFLARNRR